MAHRHVRFEVPTSNRLASVCTYFAINIFVRLHNVQENLSKLVLNYSILVQRLLNTREPDLNRNTSTVVNLPIPKQATTVCTV